ncbi:MAG: hypothetical protein KF718_07200 [Polyangiaceae bacterium]|nr:hypothetical protein [Polyangiaceae bacterium]
MERSVLEGMSRPELVKRAGALGIERPDVMTRVELMDEILRRVITDAEARRKTRGWLGVARDLVASLIEQGFHLPDAAALVRRAALSGVKVNHQPPVATVTLAEIYATQGHVKRALAMLDEVLARESDHQAARQLRDRLLQGSPGSGVEPTGDEPEADAAEVEEVEASDDDALDDAPATGAAGVPERTAEVDGPAEHEASRDVVVFEPARDLVALRRCEPALVRVYWEVRGSHFARGDVVLRVVSFVPGWGGAERVVVDRPVSRGVGMAVVEVAPGAVVRAAVGVSSATGFSALAVAVELTNDGAAERPGPSPDASALERAAARLMQP